MALKKIPYLAIGFLAGFIAASVFFSPEVMAQYRLGGASGDFKEDEMKQEIPQEYGRLVGIWDLNMYFQSSDGTIYIVRPKTSMELDSHVTVIKRGK